MYRDRNGVEYESVPLPSHEVTDAVPLEARLAGRRTERVTRPFYEGADGAVLADQPRGHRKRWSDAQWAAFEEHRHAQTDGAAGDVPFAAGIVIKPSSTNR